MRARLAVAVFILVSVALGPVVQGRGPGAVRAQTPDPLVPAVTVPQPPRPLPPVTLPPPTPVRLDRMDVMVEIDGQIAATTVDLVFRNPGARPEEATLLFPVPPGIAIADFTLTVDGQTLEGEVLGRDEATRIYTGIVQRQKDPALLEYVGLNVLRARVFPVPPGGESRLTLRFTQLLPVENGTLRYRLPLSAGAETGPTLARLTINARVANERGIGSLFSPTQTMRFDRQGETLMTASYEAANIPARGAFELNVLPAGEAVPAGLIAYRTPGEDGFFMLLLAPPLRQEMVVDKDVVIVLDTSGSMAGVKIMQAKAALRFVLNRLNPGDRFNVVSFSSTVDRFATSLQPASAVNDAIAYVDRLRAEGGTNINDALLTALGMADPERPTTIIFLTDGLPTIGEQDSGRILRNVKDNAPGSVRLFVFGVGDDVDTTLLDSLATQNRGGSQYVPPRDDVEESVSRLYSRISAPQLTDVQLDFGAANVFDVYPSPIPDLFGGQTLFVYGRYRNATSVNVRLSGGSRDGPQSFTFENMQLAENSRQASYIPHLWAQVKVGTLLREIRLRGASNSRELIDEVVALSTRYGIVTPYTSFLVVEPTALSPQAAASAVARVAAAPDTGAAATGAAAQTGALVAATPAPLRTATPTARPPTATPIGPPGAVPAPPPPLPAPTANVDRTLEQRFVADKSFVLRDGVWTDTAFQPGTETIKVAFASDAYFELLVQNPDLAPYFAVGERLIVVFEGTAYEVTAG
jgi:Ca-activated chloride channel family protein